MRLTKVRGASGSRSGALVAAALVLLALLWPADVLASGTLQERTLTFAGSATESATFNFEGSVASGASVRLWLDVQSEGVTTVPPGSEPFPTPTGVSFTLKYNAADVPGTVGGSAVPTLTFTAQNMADGYDFVASSLPVEVTTGKPAVGRYEIIFTFGGDGGSATVDKVWQLQMSGVPLATRAMVYIEDKGHFQTLSPAGACGASACPVGQTCKGPCVVTSICKLRPEICKIVWEPVWFDWPPGPCLSCPMQWQGPIEEQFERAVVSFTALGKEGEALGAGHAKEIQLNIEGGRAVGELADLGDGQYAMLVESRKGEPSPRVSATIAGVKSGVLVAGSVVAGGGGSQLPLVLGILLVIALAVIGYLSRRAGAGTSAR